MSNGFGNGALGYSAFGFGEPSSINSSAAKLWIKADGTQGNCAKIDPKTGDYVLDDSGNSVGEDSLNQMVYLALNTIHNKSAVPGFGFDVITNNATKNAGLTTRIKLAVYNAVKHLTEPGLISIVSVAVNTISSTGYEILIEWRNNASGEHFDLTI